MTALELVKEFYENNGWNKKLQENGMRNEYLKQIDFKDYSVVIIREYSEKFGVSDFEVIVKDGKIYYEHGILLEDELKEIFEK